MPCCYCSLVVFISLFMTICIIKYLWIYCSQEERERIVGSVGTARLWSIPEHEISFFTVRLNSQSYHVVNADFKLVSYEHSGSKGWNDGATVCRSLSSAVSSTRPVIHAFQGSYVPRE